MSDWDDDNFQWRSVGGEFSSCRDTLGLPMLGKDAARCCSGGTFVPNKAEGCPGSIDEDMGKEIDPDSINMSDYIYGKDEMEKRLIAIKRRGGGRQELIPVEEL